jgi:hypothetical protein
LLGRVLILAKYDASYNGQNDRCVVDVSRIDEKIKTHPGVVSKLSDTGSVDLDSAIIKTVWFT